MSEKKLEFLSPSHRAWLSAHPHRTQKWLKRAISEGFEVHHVDGDHGNNDPANLVLIEFSDHRMIHSGRRHLGFVGVQFLHKSWARAAREITWFNRQRRLREACLATMHWLDGGFWPKSAIYPPRKVAKSEMVEWWKAWGGGRRWNWSTSHRLNVYGTGLAELPRENYQLGIAFPYFADMDRDSGEHGHG